MLRTLFTFALSLLLIAEASAQTTPAATSTKPTVKSAKATARTSRRAAKKARRVALKTTPVAPRLNDGWPALDDSQTAVAATNAPEVAGAYGAPVTTSRADVDLVYASPGMPVHIRTSKEMVPYSVRPPRKAAGTQTTLSGN